MRPRAALRIAAPLLALAGCGGVPEPAREVDLRAFVPEAEIWRETAAVDFSTRPEPALRGGWSAPSRDDSDFLWGFGERSELELRRADTRPFRIRLRGWAHPRLTEGQEVRASLNGVALGSARFGAAPGVVEFSVGEGVARAGLNRLAFDYPVVVPTGRFARPFGPALDGVRFDAVGGAAELPQLTAAGWLLPGGTGIDLFPELRTGDQLELAGMQSSDGARLAVDVECAVSGPQFDLPAKSRWGGRWHVTLGAAGDAAKACRLTLRVAPGAARPGSVRIARALLHSSVANVPSAAASIRQVREAPSFVIYLVDALRADRLGAYGNPRGLTPAIDQLATGATLFENARAQSSWTRPAVATIFTGLTPLRHGAVDLEDRLPAEAETMGERLRARGYRTAYVTTNGNTAAAFGFDQGIDFFRRLASDTAENKVPWSEANAAALAFVDSVPAATPYLLVVHTVEPHAPYRPAARHRARFATDADAELGERPVLVTLPGRPPTPEFVRDVADLYDAEVASADEGFAAFLAELDRRGRRGESSILLLSDHGEELFDHGNVEHGRTLYEEQLRIPAIWTVPGGAPRRVAETFDQLDVLPTILELAGAPADPVLPGRSFAAALYGGPAPVSRASAAWLDRLHFHEDAIVDGGLKLRRDRNPAFRAAVAAEELFDLARDPGEQRPLEIGGDFEIRVLRARLRGWAARSGPPLAAEAAAIDDRLRLELRALGYIQ